MSLLDRLFGKAVNPNATLNRTWSQAPRSETTRLPQLFHQSPRLDPVELIASTIAGAPIEIFDRIQLRRDPKAIPAADHPFYDLMDNPTPMFPELDEYALKYITVVLVELLGECFWIKIRDGRKVVELLPMPPAWCILTPTSANPRFLFQPFGTTAGKTLQVAPEDVVWFKQPDITDPYGRGRGRTEAVGGELDSDEMAEKWQKNYFYNDATPPFWANLPGVQTSDLERMRDSWSQRLGGWLNARKPAFTNSENLQIIKLADSMREMDFVQSRKWMRDVFLQHYAIPPEMFGILESSNRSTIDSAYYLFSKNVISKRLGFYERAINRQLVSVDFDNRLVMRFKFQIPEDEQFTLTKVNEGLARGALTRADWKKAMGYPVEAGDEVYLIPYSLAEVPKGGVKPAPEQPLVVPAPAESTETVEPFVEVADADQPAPAPAKSATVGTPRKLGHWKAADSKATQGEGMFRSRIRTYSATQQARLNKELAKNPEAYQKALDTAFSGADEALLHALAPAWLASMTDGAELGRNVLSKKVAPSFTLYNKEFDAWVKLHGLKKAKEINETTYDALRKKMAEQVALGIGAGEGVGVGISGQEIAPLSQRMLDVTAGVYEDMSSYRATMIARTETMTSVNFGQQVVYESEGVKQKEWTATQDERTRPDHLDADAQVVAINDAFTVGGQQLEYPGDPRGDAGNVINCRCTILPVIDG